MTVHDAQSKTDLALADLKGSADMAEISGLWLSPQRCDPHGLHP